MIPSKLIEQVAILDLKISLNLTLSFNSVQKHSIKDSKRELSKSSMPYSRKKKVDFVDSRVGLLEQDE